MAGRGNLYQATSRNGASSRQGSKGHQTAVRYPIVWSTLVTNTYKALQKQPWHDAISSRSMSSLQTGQG